MDPTLTRELGGTGVRVTQLGLGGAGFGNAAIAHEDATGAMAAAWDEGVRYFDTAPWYGCGLSEHRVGDGLRHLERSSYVLSTKVGRLLRPPEEAPPGRATGFEVRFDYGYDAVVRSYEDSIQRLMLPSIDLAIVHDLDSGYHAPAERMDAHLARLVTGGWDALADLKRAGLIRAAGVGINRLGLIPRFLELFDVDFFLLASPYTLMEQRALDLELPMCERRGVGIVIGAVFNSGLLVTGDIPGATYDYRDPTPEERARVRRIHAVCERHRVPPAAAALQFPLGHPAVASVIPGALAPAHVRENVAHFRQPIPDGLWDELRHEGLIREDAPLPS